MKSSAEVISVILKKFFPGMNVDYLAKGRKIVEQLANNPIKYDLILIDLMMPDVDGVEVFKEIRNLDTKYTKTVPCVAYTGIDAPKALLEQGFNDVYLKGSSIDKLLDIFEQILKIKPFK